MRNTPIMCRPKMITTIPPTFARMKRRSNNSLPKAEEATPSVIKTALKPRTNANPCVNVTKRLLAVASPPTARPPRYPIYAGTRENTQGERKEANPARNASPMVTCAMSMLYLLLKPFRSDLCLCADYDGSMIRKGHAHLALRQRHIGSRPAENPFRILRCDVDTTMGALFAKSIVPERAMDRDPIAADHRVPWHGRRGIP